METSLGVLSDPKIYTHYTELYTYQINIVQQSALDYQFNYFINTDSIEFVISEMVNAWETPVQNFEFSFFNFVIGASGNQAYFELNGFDVSIKYLDRREDLGNDNPIEVFDFEEFLNQDKP